MENGYSESKIKISPIATIFIFFQIMFVIGIIISLSNLFHSDKIDAGDYDEQPKITIENLRTTLPDYSDVDAIERNLLRIVQNNTNEVNLKSATASMRNIEEKYFSQENLHYLSFIVDIPDLSQSYQIFYKYSDDKDNQYIGSNDSVILLCLSEYETKLYEDFNCKDLYSQTTRNAIVAEYLPYFDFNDFSAFIDLSDISEIFINPIDIDTTDESKKNSYINVVKEKITSLGISPEIFNYHIIQPSDLTYIVE